MRLDAEDIRRTRRRSWPRPRAIVGAVLAALAFGWAVNWSADRLFGRGSDKVDARLIDRIITAETSGCHDAKNVRSSALGAGQFLDQTWLELIRANRPDLARRTEQQLLDLRRDPALAREITLRLAERNAAALRARGLPVTHATLYLSHFAGAAGAVALLSSPGDADAASVMASADGTGRMTREKIVTANPFLKRFTVADLKAWAEHKMRGRDARLASLLHHGGARGQAKSCS